MDDFTKAQLAYSERFGEMLGTEMMPPQDVENLPEIVKNCLETNTPYKCPELPKGCIA